MLGDMRLPSSGFRILRMERAQSPETKLRLWRIDALRKPGQDNTSEKRLGSHLLACLAPLLAKAKTGVTRTHQVNRENTFMNS